MAECGGFTITCVNEAAAQTVGDAVKAFLIDRQLEDNFWVTYLTVKKTNVAVDAGIHISWDDFDGLFADICCYIDDKFPNTIVSGSASYTDTVDGFSTSFSLEQTPHGLVIRQSDDDGYDSWTDAPANEAEENVKHCLACGGVFPEEECHYVEKCGGYFCDGCYADSFGDYCL